jgi:hypothetical protein
VTNWKPFKKNWHKPTKSAEIVIGPWQIWRDDQGRNWYVQGASFRMVTATTAKGMKAMILEDEFRKHCRLVRRVKP